MATNPVRFEATAFVATAQQLLSIAAQNVYNSYPPYNLDIYNSYIQQTRLPAPPRFIPRPIPSPLSADQTIPILKPNIQNKIEGDMLSYGNHHCDIFASDWDYDLDWDSLQENQITINQLLQSQITQYSPAISGIWRPFFLYVDAQNKSIKNTFVTRSASAQEDTYEAGLKWENFITIQNPTLKNWLLSGGTTFKIDWKIDKDNFLTAPVLGLLFWYRYYDVNRETNIKKTYEIKPYTETVSQLDLPGIRYNNIDYVAQTGLTEYANTASHVNVERYGLHSELVSGDRVLIKEAGKDYIYEVNEGYWENLGEKRFINGVDIYVPEDQFTVYFESVADKDDWFGGKPDEISSFSYPKTSLKTKDIDKYSNMLNKLLNFEDNIGLQNLFQLSPAGPENDSTSSDDDEDEEEPSFIAGIYLDKQQQADYIAVKNLARFLCTAPVANSEYIKATTINLSNLNFKNFANIYAVKTDLENIFGYNISQPSVTVGDRITQPMLGNVPMKAGSAAPSIMTSEYTANIKAQNGLLKSFDQNFIYTKKDLLRALFQKNKKNRFIEFPKGQKTKLVSKFNINEPHLRIVMDFQDVKTLGVRNFQTGDTVDGDGLGGVWYKQRINVAGLELYTRLKFPDESALGPNEKEALVLKYIDKNNQDDNKTEVPIIMASDTINSSKEYYNQVINSVYEKFGIARLFQQKYNLENSLLISDNSGEYYDVLLTNNNGQSLKIFKNTTYQENQTFDNAVRFFKYTIDEYAKNVPKFEETNRLVEQRFNERATGSKGGILPNIKEVYMHRIGGFYLQDISFLTVGVNKFWRSRTAPAPIGQAQYFLPKSIRADIAAKPLDSKNITIEFECGKDTTIELYGINVTSLRDDTLERASCRPFPNKIPVYGDEISVYNAAIGFDFNESSHLLSTQFAPPIVAYGGHRSEDIDVLGLNIPGHPKPISATNSNYLIKQENILPQAAKNSSYYNRNQDQLTTAARSIGRSVLRDKSLVKCFLTPTNFTNEITFRKGFFHPNKGWIDYTVLPPDLQNKTAAKSISDSPCRIYTGAGALFRELTLTVADDNAKPDIPTKGKDYSIITRDPMEIYGDGNRAARAFPNILTIDLDPNTNFITHISATLKNLTHPVPKELKIALFDSLEQRWIAFNYIKAELEARMNNKAAQEDPNFQAKIQKQIAREKNAWIGSWETKPRTSPRHLLFHSSLLNYSSNFNAFFTNFSRKNIDYAFSNDFIAPAQSLDYYIGTSATYTGFWNYDGPIPDGINPDDIDAGTPPPEAPPFVGEPSTEVGKTWGISASDMGAEDEGGSCLDLQVCTGCPVAGYTQSYIFNRFHYNNETFNMGYPAGYNFIANFRNKKHLLPPINLDAPYTTINPEYPKQNVGSSSAYGVQLGCIPQPDPPRPRETVLPEFKPEPIFVPPFHPSIVGLLTYMGIANALQAQGYGWDLGFLTGVFFPSPFYFGTTRREKLGRYMENKGYLQIEGSTDDAKQLFGFQVRDIGLYDDAPFGQADKVQLEIKHPNGLWYNVEADIFKYSSHCSPVLENTKFNYLKHNKYLTEDESEDQNFTKPLSYPGFDFHVNSMLNTDRMSIDGVRAYYSFMKGEVVELNYKTIYTAITSQDQGNCVECKKTEKIESHKINITIKDIYIETINNPWYKETEIKVQDPSVIEVSLKPPEILYPDDFIDETSNVSKIVNPRVIIQFEPPIDLTNNDPNSVGPKAYLEGVIHKAATGSQCTSFLLFDPIVTDGKIAPSGNINYKRGENDTSEPFMYAGDKEIGGLTYSNNADIVNFGKWSNVRDRNLGTFTSSYIFDQLYAEGGLGWGTNLIKPESLPVIGNQEKYPTLLDLDYHYSKTNYCGRVKFTKGYDPTKTHTGYVKFNPRLVYNGMAKHPYTQTREDNLISFTGYPRPLDIIPNRIYAHNVLNISEQNASVLNIDAGEMHQRYKYNPETLDYYLPFYDLTLDNQILDEDLASQKPAKQGQISASSGIIQIENIFNNKKAIIYDNNYYWISIPAEATGVISGSSKIPVAVIQKCFHSKATFSFCSNMCNTEGRGPVWPDFDKTDTNSHESIYKLPSESVPRATDVTYEERQTKQTYYVGCGETSNDSLVRMDVIQVYEVPVQSHTYVPVSELLAEPNEITVRFKYLPRKIPTDFKVTLGNNIVNQSQLYLWECHKTNVRHLYNSTTITNTPPFYQILNEMIFRSWFGERQKISLQETYDRQIFMTQNHYKWVPYDYDDSGKFTSERNIQ
jgi:hypothetical protein